MILFSFFFVGVLNLQLSKTVSEDMVRLSYVFVFFLILQKKWFHLKLYIITYVFHLKKVILK